MANYGMLNGSWAVDPEPETTTERKMRMENDLKVDMQMFAPIEKRENPRPGEPVFEAGAAGSFAGFEAGSAVIRSWPPNDTVLTSRAEWTH